MKFDEFNKVSVLPLLTMLSGHHNFIILIILYEQVDSKIIPR